MSNRTVQADKAIREAWQKEQNLVRDGKGTRDWTLEQQQDILSSGKAYDENGRAFEGQHMKSVEKYPEYQWNPDNIQFLTKREHLAAHGGSWQNPTNWYYNPVTMERIDFGDGPCIPCEIIDLSELYIPKMPEEAEIIENGNDNPDKAEIAKETGVAPPDVSDHPAVKVPKAAPTVRPKRHSFGQVLKQAGKTTVEWLAKHPGVSTFLKLGAATAGTYVLDRLFGGNGNGLSSKNSANGNGYDNSKPYSSDSCDGHSFNSEPEFDSDMIDASSEPEEGHGKGTPKAPHDTSGYTRTRNGKIEHVRGYSTGKNREEESPSEDSCEE